mgnify:CR=1 FL=1|tara:strand:+ start:6664 stop:6975 length:312 start_codon:yes stop_codon:yes gene_type:complete
MEFEKLNLLKTKTSFLVLLFSLSFNSYAIAMNNQENNIYWYGFSWGGMMATCMYYDSNLIAKKEAKDSISMMLDVAKEEITDVAYYDKLIQLLKKKCGSLTPN